MRTDDCVHQLLVVILLFLMALTQATAATCIVVQIPCLLLYLPDSKLQGNVSAPLGTAERWISVAGNVGEETMNVCACMQEQRAWLSGLCATCDVIWSLSVSVNGHRH